MTSAIQPEELDSAVYKTLLESTKAIPWKLDWATMKFAYIGPQIESLLGWPQSSWVGSEDWASRIDLPPVTLPTDSEKSPFKNHVACLSFCA